MNPRISLIMICVDDLEKSLRLGAHEVVVSKDADPMKKHQGSFNFMLEPEAM